MSAQISEVHADNLSLQAQINRLNSHELGREQNLGSQVVNELQSFVTRINSLMNNSG